MGATTRRAVLLALFFAFTPALAAHARLPLGAPEDRGVTQEEIASLRELLSGAVESGEVPGVSFLLAVEGEIVFREGFGNMPVDRGARIASSTKPFTAATVMLLVDRGKLSLDDAVSKHLPEFKGAPVENATIRQMLSHTSGMLPRYPEGTSRRGTQADLARAVAKKGSFGEMGKFVYGGVSLDVAARICEVVDGASFEEQMAERIYRPLGLTSSSFAGGSDPDTAKPGEGRYVSAGGGMSSTLDDVAVFFQMLLDGGVHGGGRILSEKSAKEMRRSNAVNETTTRSWGDAFGDHYGLGLYLGGFDEEGVAGVASHGGAFGTMPWIDEERGVVGVFFTQVRLRRAAPLMVRTQSFVRSIVPLRSERGDDK